MQQSNVVQVTLDNFQQVILETSQQKPVLVDLYSDQVEASRALSPILERIASDYSDDLVLARINCDIEQDIAMQFGVRSLPTVVVIKEGRPVDGFAGPQPEAFIQEMLAKYLPRPEEKLLQEAEQKLAENDPGNALGLLRQAKNLAPRFAPVLLALAQTQLQLNQLDECKETLSNVPLEDQNSDYQHLVAQLELKEQAADTPEIRTLQEQYEQSDADPEIAIQLAVKLQEVGRNEEALALLYGLLRRDLNAGDGAVKKSFMDLLSALPNGDPLASSYRRKIYSLLY